MEEKKGITVRESSDIAIKKCTDGFLVIGEKYAGDNLHAFSTAEGLIEWLSRELGAGPIVWSVTLELWAGLVEMKPEDLFPVPDQATDPAGYQRAIADNATVLIAAYLRRYLEKHYPQPPPEPKPKKEKKVKEEKRMVVARLGLEPEEEKVKDEGQRDTPGPDTRP